VAHYLTHPGIDRHLFAAAMRFSYGPIWPILVIAIFAGLCLAASGDRVDRLLGVTAAAAVATWFFTPQGVHGLGSQIDPVYFSQALRLLFPALVCSLLIVARRTQHPWASATVAAVAGVVVVASQYDSVRHDLKMFVAILAALGAVFLLRRPMSVRVAGALAVAVVAGGLVAVGWDAHRYTSALSDEEVVWSYFQNIHDARVAESAFFEQYPLFSSDVSNRVSLAGTMQRTHTQLPTSCRMWADTIRSERYDYIVIGPNEYGVEPGPIATWTAQLLGQPQLATGRYAVYKIPSTFGLCAVAESH
jgi:hypothetical protein